MKLIGYIGNDRNNVSIWMMVFRKILWQF